MNVLRDLSMYVVQKLLSIQSIFLEILKHFLTILELFLKHCFRFLLIHEQIRIIGFIKINTHLRIVLFSNQNYIHLTKLILFIFNSRKYIALVNQWRIIKLRDMFPGLSTTQLYLFMFNLLLLEVLLHLLFYNKKLLYNGKCNC